MTTAPFAAGAASAIASAHRQVCRIFATHPTFTAPIALVLDPKAGHRVTLDLDGTRAPRVTARISCALPPGVDPTLLDPRAGVRLEIHAGYVAGEIGEDVHRLFDLGLRTSGEDLRTGAIDLVATSDESLAIDASPAVAGSVTGTTHAQAIETLLAQVISPAPRLAATVAGAAVTVDPLTDRWDTIADLADRLEARCFDDGTRTWRLEPTPTLAGTPDLDLAAGAGSVLLEATPTLDRDAWHNYVALTYEWRDTAGADQVVRATAYATTGPYAITGPAGRRILDVTRNVPTTQAEANTAAGAILRRALTRGATAPISAVAAYWLRPGSTVRATLGDRPPALYLLDRVTFYPLEGRMDLDPRLPDDAPTVSTTTPTGGPRTTDPLPPARATYSSTWAASSWATYQGNGTQRTDLTAEFAAGWGGTPYGDQQAVILFTGANSTGSETGKTITQALTGADVTGVSVTMTATSARRTSTGSTARLGAYAGTTLPATKTGDETFTASSEWTAGTRRTVPLTSAGLVAALEAGTARGLVAGPSAGDFDGMRFDGATVELTITYAK